MADGANEIIGSGHLKSNFESSKTDIEINFQTCKLQVVTYQVVIATEQFSDLTTESFYLVVSSVPLFDILGLLDNHRTKSRDCFHLWKEQIFFLIHQLQTNKFPWNGQKLFGQIIQL